MSLDGFTPLAASDTDSGHAAAFNHVPIEALAGGKATDEAGRRLDWTNAQERILTQYYPLGGTRECLDRLPRRSIHAIRIHARSLGLKAPPYRRAQGILKIASTDEIDNAIRLGFGNQQPRFLLKLASKVGRSGGWIKRRAAELGIVVLPLRNKDWTVEEDRLLATEAGQGTNLAGIVRLLKQQDFVRSLPAVRSRLFRIAVALDADCETTGTYNVIQLAALFGVEWQTVKKWIVHLDLPAKREKGNTEWRIKRRSLRHWVIKNLAAINFHTLDKFWFAALLYGEME
jgi:hypothetical protein